MHSLDLILTLAAGFVGALTLGYITHRLGWSTIVGYLVAGVLIGPKTPGFVADRAIAEQLSEVGVILLMFGVGLHFHLKDLLAVKRIAIAGAVFQSATATAVGAWALHSFGWGWSTGIVYGLALSVASTVVLIRVLSEAGEVQSATGRIAIGWLVVEDIFTVFILVLLPAVYAASGGPGAIAAAAGWTGLKLAGFAAVMLLGGSRLIPWLFNRVAETRSRELFTLAVLAVALGIAVGSAEFFGVSMALGAFLAGMVVGQSDFSARAGSDALPLRDAFAVMFFLSVGMLFDPAEALANPIPVVVTLAIVMLVKPLAAVVIVALLGYNSRVGFGVALALAQVGEFTFLLASLATQLGALPAGAMNPVVAAAIVSITLNPLLYRVVPRLEAGLRRNPRLWSLLNRRQGVLRASPALHDDAPAHHAVIVGYGPVGRLVTDMLRRRGLETTVIEMNIDTFHRLQANGMRAVYGDANQSEVLEQAGVRHAASLILSASGSAALTEAIRIARELNSDIHVVARADFVNELRSLRLSGADEVFTGEGEVALAMADSILRDLGATPDQLDETRERIREELTKA